MLAAPLLLFAGVLVILIGVALVRQVLRDRHAAAIRHRLLELPRTPTHFAPLGPGSFATSDPRLNRIWRASVRTAETMLAPGGLRQDALERDCKIDVHRVILDGWVRDRCPYIGDESVIDLTLDVSDPHYDVQRDMLAWFARAQREDGAIPASPIFESSIVLFDYNAYWIQTLYEFTLHSGDLAFAREMFPHLERLLGWYVRQTSPSGLVVNHLGSRDYAYIQRSGDVVAYYNAQYVVALERAAQIARWLSEPTDSAKWLTRSRRVRVSFVNAFWDARAGAFTDTTTDKHTHPQDANAFAVLAGLATHDQARGALAYLSRRNARFYGNTISDSTAWNHPYWGTGANERVYPFISYYEVIARYEAGLAPSALELIRREWGYMLEHGPRTTMWEVIGPAGGAPTDPVPSWDAGWSSGAAPALTAYVLGVQPTSPGFATFTVKPRVGDLTWAAGDVPTPHGLIHVSWRVGHGRKLVLHVTAPPKTAWVRD